MQPANFTFEKGGEQIEGYGYFIIYRNDEAFALAAFRDDVLGHSEDDVRDQLRDLLAQEESHRSLRDV